MPLKPFAMGELEAALRQVPCESVKALPMHGRRTLLNICSRSVATLALSLLHGKEGVAVPLLKPHKPGDDPAPYHPVTPASNLCNLPEQIVSRPVRGHLEDKLQPQQPGLRPHRSTADPLDLLLRKVVQPQPATMAGAAFVDCARAFDWVDNDAVITALRKFSVAP
ncbi:hypothetical protein LMJF_20_1750 [Leishmania major strain Friedlin]|uniref:Reverse transcriptase domain-containing protein n=1 Tax=Leishmania major TaxID=5664 RepID=Q4QCM7_LEIMA|nr:hypothetical protein LMJF_20_1540 [Leishmania major strain Friedlin]XP_001682921.1 hypothetical protein LMJF_20_1750 [Leishmania major strain Friedlin]CAG9573229.1 hypothetical_protein-unknown_function [Leishmania major strain Friedlin]CAG9573242.1 hypothetical_protein [Leishmania major strain Friedlin]CAJ04453.1 hypothetical protein LMJF_20_1540 [Leishmania major strain Friedlin]CAJ04539.1 hypothetical protein LMJF_20_1750 [Leishmania major strain Friedlin]|eukprot:XP_001682908.1 hypothetical protein LMJF_20_1540 [Leishmania major strain Friedlin]